MTHERDDGPLCLYAECAAPINQDIEALLHYCLGNWNDTNFF